MKMKKLFHKAFGGGCWQIACRDLQSKETAYRFVRGLPQGQWVADPFLFEYEGQHYLFCEQYETEKNRAGIGCFQMEDGVPVSRGIVLRQPYHMSYPCVFSYGDAVYMIPETSANKTVELYRAVQFPDRWELDTVLLENVSCVDTTYYKSEEGHFLLSYEKRGKEWVLTTFSLDMEQKTLQKCRETVYRKNTGRPAGSLWQEAGKLYRPAQDCSEKYGQALLIYQIVDGQEQLAKRITAEDTGLPAQRIHTINRNSRYEAIDVFQEHFDFFHGWKIFKRAVLKK